MNERRKMRRSGPSGRLEEAPASGENRRRKHALLLLFFALFLIAAAAFFRERDQAAEMASVADPMSNPKQKHVWDRRVNLHRMSTAHKMENAKTRVQAENYLFGKSVNPGATENETLPLKFDQEIPVERSGRRALPGPFQYPDHQVMRELEYQKMQDYYERQERDRFVQDFISNAADAGIRVEIDDDLTVQSVDRLPNAAPEDSGAGGASN